jgi:outer membrane lipoprotein-sorting protein
MEGKMKKIFNFIVFAVTLSFTLNAFAAEKLKQPTVEYSADTVIQSGQMSSTGKLYHALGGKDRMEMNAQGTTAITITRTDKKVAWVLMPAQNMYMEMSLEESAKKSGNTNVNDCDIDLSSLGDETVNGVKATKNKISGTCPDNTKYEGTMWVTKEGIMVKMESVATVDGQQANVTMDLKNLKIGPQEASLFEVPAGYQKFDMGSISSMFKNAQDQAAKAQAEAAKAQEQAAKEAKEKEASDSSTGRAYTAQGRAYTASGSSSNATGPVSQVDKAVDEVNKPIDTTEKVKGTINKLKGIFGK